jgi:hypothetical protein
MNNLTITMQLVNSLNDAHRYVEAESYAPAVVDGETQTQPDNWERYWAESRLGEALSGQKKYADAEHVLRSPYDGLSQRKATIPAYRRHAIDDARDDLAALYTAWGKPAQAAKYKKQ